MDFIIVYLDKIWVDIFFCFMIRYNSMHLWMSQSHHIYLYICRIDFLTIHFLITVFDFFSRFFQNLTVWWLQGRKSTIEFRFHIFLTHSRKKIYAICKSYNIIFLPLFHKYVCNRIIWFHEEKKFFKQSLNSLLRVVF